MGKNTKGFKIIIIRESEPKEAQVISDLISSHADTNLLLPRSPEEISDNHQNHLVALDEEMIVGTIGFKVWEGKLPEIIAYVVQKEYQGQHIGYNMLGRCIEKIGEENHPIIWALTTEKFSGTFLRHGFEKDDLRRFPIKIWTDCRECLKNRNNDKNKDEPIKNKPDCDEISLSLMLD